MKKRISAWLLVFVMVFSLFPATVFAADGDEPTNSKELKDNGDGTYTITLSVTGQGDTTTTTSGANVVVVLDVSGSMDEGTGQTVYQYREWNNWSSNGSRYGKLDDGTYVELTRRGTPGNRTYWYWTEVTDEDGNTALQEVQYTGTIYERYTTDETRLDAAKAAINTLAETLFAQNTAENPETIQMSFVVFADTGFVRQIGGGDVTTDEEAFKEDVDGRYANGGTNWEDGLQKAAGIDFGDDDPTYVIFISDGNPTFRMTKGNPTPGYTRGKYGEGWFGDQYYSAADDEEYDTRNYSSSEPIYGNGWDENSGYFDLAANNVARCYNEAIDDAKAIVDNGGTLYTIGAYGSVDRMSSLTDYAYGGNGSDYYNSVTDTAALNSTLAKIADEITNSLALTNVSFSDGITGMTSVAVSGSADGFTYKKNGEAWADAPAAKFEDGKVVWDLGTTKLANGESASVSFVVYPSQEALDLIADLNNGKVTWDSLTDAQKSQIDSNEGKAPYSLKTNTEAKLTYSTVTETTDASGNTTTTTSDPATIDMTRTGENGITVESTQLKLKKAWNADLDEQQLHDLLYNKDGSPTEHKVTLDVKKGDDVYLADQVLGWDADKNGYVWEKDFAIAPGIMVSAEQAAKTGLSTEGKPTVTYEGETYYLLVEGHDYTVEEKSGGDYHFELEEKVYHPMYIDGTLYNVTIEGNEVKSAEEMDAVTATNNLKGGILITKTVEVAEGSADPADPSEDAFQIRVDMKNADGSAYEVAANEGGWRIIYGENNPDGEDEINNNGNYGRSDRSAISGGTFTATVYAGDQILVGNVNSGVTYEVKELADELPDGYTFKSIEGKDGETALEPEDGVVKGTVQANTSSAVTITNTYEQKLGTLKITKVFEVLPEDKFPEGLKFTITGPDNFSKEVEYADFEEGSYELEVAPGEYTVAESGADAEIEGYKFIETTYSPEGGKATVSAGATATVTVTNTYAVATTPIVPGDTVNYIVEHYKADDNGEYPEEPTDKEMLGGKIGDTVTAEPKDYEGYCVNPQAEGYKDSDTLKKIEKPEDIVVLKLYYDKDVIGEKDPDEPDKIPDKYQVTVIYEADSNGALVEGALEKEVLTLTNDEGKWAETGDITATGSEAEQKVEGYAFDNWTNDTDDQILYNAKSGEIEFTEVNGGDEITVTANFAEDKNEDGIPDKYQVFVKYEADENGKITGMTEEVFTAEKDEDGKYAETVDVETSGSEAEPNEGYALDNWTNDKDDQTSKDGKFTFEAVEGGSTITITANFAEDKNDDDIPDKYQATVTYKVVNGTWSDGTTEDKQVVVTLKEQGEDGQWTDITPAPMPTDVPTGMKANEGYENGKWDKDPANTAVTKDMTFTYTFTKKDTPKPPVYPPVLPPELNTKDHFAYIIGSDDGLVRPDANITRAEVATIFFRMLTDESRNNLWTQNNNFTDVSLTQWFNNAVSTMANGGVVNGYPDASFKPNANITRAEFATIAIRFFKDAKAGEISFSDIYGHWAEENIRKAAAQGLINGYPDGTFRPDAPITRAEAMAIVNRVLGRKPDADHMLSNMITFVDNMNPNAWYYADVQEATNSHDYEMSGIGYEIWKAILPVRDWAAFENAWSNANAATNPGNVMD